MPITPIISIIVPVYNVDGYLARCLDSVLAQSFTDFELILIDDGSPDNSGYICDEYAARETRIRVIHQENAGVGSARNTGLDAAVGKYIYFVDPDDSLEPNALEVLLENATTYNSDLVVCGYTIIHECENGILKTETKNVAPQGSFTDYAEELSILHRNTLLFMLWNKLYKKEIIEKNQLRFSNIKRLEDATFNYAYLHYCDSITFLPTCIYRYSIFHTQQITATKRYIANYQQIYFNVYKAGCALIETLKRKKMKNVSMFYAEIQRHLYSSLSGDLVINLSRSSLGYKRRYMYTKQALQQYKTCNIQISPTDLDSIPDKLICFLVNIKAKHLLVLLSYVYSARKTR